MAFVIARSNTVGERVGWVRCLCANALGLHDVTLHGVRPGAQQLLVSHTVRTKRGDSAQRASFAYTNTRQLTHPGRRGSGSRSRSQCQMAAPTGRFRTYQSMRCGGQERTPSQPVKASERRKAASRSANAAAILKGQPDFRSLSQTIPLALAYALSYICNRPSWRKLLGPWGTVRVLSRDRRLTATVWFREPVKTGPALGE